MRFVWVNPSLELPCLECDLKSGHGSGRMCGVES